MNLKFQHFNPLENMLLNIKAEGKDRIWLDIEAIKHPLCRLQQKHIYFQALKILERRHND